MSTDNSLPKPMYPYIARMYEAVVSQGFSPGSISRENADTVVRNLFRIPEWSKNNQDVISMWNLGGDGWGDLVKDVKHYSGLVNKHRKFLKSEEKRKNNENK